MKKYINFLIFILVLFVIGYFVMKYWPNSTSPIESVAANNKKLKVSVVYSRPFLNRKIFGELVPYGTIWRTGAKAATLITFSKNCSFGGKFVKAGQYSLWSIPDQKQWVIILNSQTGQWGTDYSEAKDYLRVKTKATYLDKPLEQLKINLIDEDSKILLNIEWENTKIEVPIY
jgi:hypothetical protein